MAGSPMRNVKNESLSRPGRSKGPARFFAGQQQKHNYAQHYYERRIKESLADSNQKEQPTGKGEDRGQWIEPNAKRSVQLRRRPSQPNERSNLADDMHDDACGQ